MNRNRLKFLLVFATALVLSACAGTSEKTGGEGRTTVAASNVNAANSAAAPNATANVTTANVSAVAPASTTTGEGTQSGTSSKDGARGGNARQGNMPKPQIGSGGNDFYLFTQARGVLNADAELKTANIAVDVKEGIMTLSGVVAGAGQKSKAEQLVRGVNGVRDVRNQLRVSGGN